MTITKITETLIANIARMDKELLSLGQANEDNQKRGELVSKKMKIAKSENSAELDSLNIEMKKIIVLRECHLKFITNYLNLNISAKESFLDLEMAMTSNKGFKKMGLSKKIRKCEEANMVLENSFVMLKKMFKNDYKEVNEIPGLEEEAMRWMSVRLASS
jgi:hypothetical protein